MIFDRFLFFYLKGCAGIVDLDYFISDIISLFIFDSFSIASLKKSTNKKDQRVVLNRR